MKASSSALPIPHMPGELSRSHSRSGTLWGKATKTCSGLLIAALILAWGLLVLGVVSLGLVGAEPEIRISPTPMVRSEPDLPVVYEPGMIFQNEDHIYYVL